MSNLQEPKNAPRTSDEQTPATAVAKPSRPNSLTNFSKPLAKDSPLIASPTIASPKLVGPEELQARIKAARRSRTASQPLPEAVRRKLEQSSDLIHPALRARSSVNPNLNRGPSHKCKSREDLSIDAVIRRLSTETSSQDAQMLLGGIPPVPALPAFPLPGTHRPRQYQSASRRSSMTRQKSPLSNVSSPDDSGETSSHTSRRTSRASSRTSKSEEYKDDDDVVEMIRVISPRASRARLAKRKHEPEPPITPIPPQVSRSKPQRDRSSRSWQGLSRRSILCSV